MDVKWGNGIRGNMDSKSTQELLDIYRSNDQAVYTKEALELVKDILVERGEVLPEQLPPIQEDKRVTSFAFMLSSHFISVIYGLGVIVISLLGLGVMIPNNSVWDIAGGILIIVVGNLFWRLACERWVVVFHIHDVLVSIKEELERLNTD